MRFDTNDTGKYIFDTRQELTGEELFRLEDEYYTRLRSDLSGAYKNRSFTNIADRANLAVTYIIIGIVIILPLLLWFVLFREMQGYPKAFMTAGIPLVGIGIMLIVKLILRLTVKKRVYSETVDAECIGYARFFETEGGENAGPRSGIPHVSPVFAYRYEGNLYTGCYDGFDISKDCPVALGPAKIDISPAHPESIYNRGAQQMDVLILFTVVFVLAGAGLTICGMFL